MADRERRRARNARQDGRRAADGFRPRRHRRDSGADQRGGLQRAAGHVQQRIQSFPRRVHRPVGARSERRFRRIRRAVQRQRPNSLRQCRRGLRSARRRTRFGCRFAGRPAQRRGRGISCGRQRRRRIFDSLCGGRRLRGFRVGRGLRSDFGERFRCQRAGIHPLRSDGRATASRR